MKKHFQSATGNFINLKFFIFLFVLTQAPMAFSVSFRSTVSKLADKSRIQRAVNVERFKTARIAAKQGFVDAMADLGLMYLNGQGVKQNFKEAKYWLEKAVEGNNAAAKNGLGVIYYKGQGTRKDLSKAIKLWKQASEQGNKEAQNNLALMHYNGEGVKQDYEKAAELWTQAAEAGDTESKFMLGVMYLNGTGVAQNNKKARILIKQATSDGHLESYGVMGYMYYHGYGGLYQSYNKAFKWFIGPADKGDAKSQYYLGLMYYKGQGVAKDEKTAIKWFEKAAEQGHKQAKKAVKDLKSNKSCGKAFDSK